MRRVTLLLLAGLCVLTPASILDAQAPPLTPFRGLIDHVSADPWGGVPSARVEIWHRAISGDGRYVVMNSTLSYLDNSDNDDSNGYDDIFLRDRMTGATTRISRPFNGGAGNGISQMGTISTNGRHVAFASGSSNLVPGDTNDQWDVFVRDLDLQRTVRVSVATDGTQGDADAYYPSLSADGRFVAFVSWATTFAPGVPQWAPRQMYLHDRDADGDGIFDEIGGITTELISVGLNGGIADDSVDSPRVTGDGRYVLFESGATNLSEFGNPNVMTHLYRRDRLTGQTVVIDRAWNGGLAQWGVGYGTSDMTDDGRYITFSSSSPDIIQGETNSQSQIYRWDAFANPTGTVIASRLPDGTLGDGSSYKTSVSADGRYVMFSTASSNLASPPPGASGPGMLAVRDMLDGTITRVDVLDSGEPFDQSEYYYTAAISADGTAIVLNSRSEGALGGSYGWGQPHVFVLTAFAADPLSATFPISGGTGTISINTSAVTGWSPDVRWYPWIQVVEGVVGAGTGIIQYQVAPNDGGIARDGYIRIGSQTVWVHQEGDGDATPPVITPTVIGTQVNGWYTGDVSVSWSVTDPDSEIVNVFGCSSYTMTIDGIAQPFCEATSHGGTSSVRFYLKRDTTPPTISITAPVATTYQAGSIVTPSFSCTDGSSGTATCAITEGSSPLDTTPGWHTFTVTATDNVGHSSTKSVEYLVGTGVCVTPNVNMTGWWRFEDDTFDALRQRWAGPTPANQFILWFAEGMSGRSWQAQPQTSSYLDTQPDQQLFVPGWQSGLTVAAWLRPTGYLGESATIVAKPAFYRIARYPDGTLRYAFSRTTGYDWVNTGVVLPGNAWSHVAVAYDAGLVKTYVNGRLVHTHQLTGTPTATGDWTASMTIGGRADATASYWGWIDDLQLYTASLSGAEVDALARAGSGSTCLPKDTTLTVNVPATVGFGPTFPVTATLRDSDGNPLANKWVNLVSHVAPGGAYAGNNSWQTDDNGQVSLAVPIASSATTGTYVNGLTAYWDGDAHYTPSWAAADVTVVRGTPAVSWPSPAAITYGTALGAAQLNATANIPGTFTYSPAAGAILGAGTHTLSVTFTPLDGERWNPTTATTTIVVDKALAILTITGGTFTYDKQPHPAVATATGVLGEPLSPFTIYYGSTTTPPVNAGTYWATVHYTGSANYLYTTKTTQVRINKAVPRVVITGGPYTYNGQARTVTAAVLTVDNNYLSPYWVQYNGGWTAPSQAGTHVVTVIYNGDSNYEAVRVDGSLVINKANPIMTPVPADRTVTYNGQPFGVTTPNVQGVNFESLGQAVVTYDGSTVRPTNVGQYAIEARYNGSTNYNPLSKTATLTILKASSSLTWPDPAGIVYGTALSGSQLNATASVPGTLSYSPAAGTVLNAGSHALSVTFTPEDAVNYNGVSATVPLTVARATPAINWPTPADIVYGTALGESQLNATTNVAGTFSYSPASGTVLDAGTRPLWVTFTPTDAANFNSINATVMLNVARAPSTVNWPNPADIVYGTPLGAAQLNATANVPGYFSYSPAAGTVLTAGSHTLSVTFTPWDSNHDGSTASVTLNVAKAGTTLIWQPVAMPTYGTPLGDAQLTAFAVGVDGTLTYSPPAGTILPAGTHTLSVTFTPNDPANYNGASATALIEVWRAASTVSWSNPAAIVYGTALGGSQLNATANVPGTFSYSPDLGAVLNAGWHTLSVTFTPDDAANYVDATKSVTLNVTKAAPAITWANPADIVYGAALGASQLNAMANVAGTFTYSPAPGTVLNAGTHQLSVSFTPTDSLNYTGASANASITVGRAAPVIAWAPPASITYGSALSATQLNATAIVAGTFGYSPAAGTVLNAGTHTLSVTFTPDDAANYDGASANVSLTVGKAASIINWSNPADMVYGTPLGGSQLNATANVAGTFTYSPATGTALNAGTHELSVTFTPADSDNYSSASANVSIVVAKAAPAITWANPAGITYGTALSGTQLNATANVNGTFVYSPAAGTVLGAGAQTLSVTFTPDDAANYATATGNVSIAVAKVTPVITWANPASLTYGTGLSGTQLNATANVLGSFLYDVPAAAELDAGTHELSVTFTPADGANYTTASRSVSIVITPAALTVRADNASKVYGQVLPSFTATGTGFVNGDSMASLSGTLTFSTAATATSAPGSYSVTPAGASSANYTITFAAGTLTINKAATGLALTTTPNPSQNNQIVQLRAVVSAVAPGAGTATGTVEFRENGTLLGTATLVNGVATLNKSFKKGTHPLTAAYAGDANFTGSSGSVTHQTP